MLLEDHAVRLEGDFSSQEVSPPELPVVANFVNAINAVGAQSINVVNPAFNLHYLKDEYGSVEQLKTKGIEGARSMVGYAIGYSAGLAVLLEQSPVNENWRVKEGIKTLIATANPAAVARRIIEITNYIELGASALIIAAVFSKSPVVEAPKEAFYKWTEMGAKRAEYREVVKEDELRVKNNWRVAQDKLPKGIAGKQAKAKLKADRHRIKSNWKNLLLEQQKIDDEQKLVEIRENNAERIAAGKKPKKNKMEKSMIRAANKDSARAAKNNWRLAKRRTKVEAKEQKLVEIRENNAERIAAGKKPKSEISLTQQIGKRAGKELEDFAIALGLGAGIVVFKNALRDRGYTVREALIDAVKASIQISLVSGFIGWTVAAGTEKAKLGVPLTDHTIHYEKQAQWVVDYGLNTKFIIGTLLALQTPSILKKLRHRLPDKERQFQKWLAKQKIEEARAEVNTELAFL